jgi:hypothetical protein
VLEAARLLLQESATTTAAAAPAVVPEQQLKAGKAALAQLVTGAAVPEVGCLLLLSVVCASCMFEQCFDGCSCCDLK